MQPFYFLEDEATADVAFIANGQSEQEAFANACNALTAVITDATLVNIVEQRQISLTAEDLPGLLYDLLDHLLFLFDTEDLLFIDNQISLNMETITLQWTGKGEPYQEDKHTIHTHVKAVTFFGMEVTPLYVKVTLDL